MVLNDLDLEKIITTKISDRITFYLNGNKINLNCNQVDPDSTLLDFIRAQPGLSGTKNGCSEGGCGACTVVLQSKHPLTSKIQHLAINACLAPLISIDGKHVITGMYTSILHELKHY